MATNHSVFTVSRNTNFVKTKCHKQSLLPSVRLKSVPAERGQSPAAKARHEAWALLVELSPQCAELLEEAKQTRKQIGRRYSPASRIFYASFRPWIQSLVGWGASNPSLRDSALYDLFYEKICSALNVYCGKADPFKELDAARKAHANAMAQGFLPLNDAALDALYAVLENGIPEEVLDEPMDANSSLTWRSYLEDWPSSEAVVTAPASVLL